MVHPRVPCPCDGVLKHLRALHVILSLADAAQQQGCYAGRIVEGAKGVDLNLESCSLHAFAYFVGKAAAQHQHAVLMPYLPLTLGNVYYRL